MFASKIPPSEEQPPTALHLLTEIALLKEAGGDAEFEQAESLFIQLLTEFESYFRALTKALAPFDGSTFRLDTDDLYAELVLTIWKKADQFNPRENGAAAIKKQFLGWAAAILKNIVHDKLAQFKLEITSTETLDAGWDAFAEQHQEPGERSKILAEILEEMDPDDAEILRWSSMSIPLDGSQMRTNAEERAELCRKLNVTPAGLRKRRERAFKSLREELLRRLS